MAEPSTKRIAEKLGPRSRNSLNLPRYGPSDVFAACLCCLDADRSRSRVDKHQDLDGRRLLRIDYAYGVSYEAVWKGLNASDLLSSGTYLPGRTSAATENPHDESILAEGRKSHG